MSNTRAKGSRTSRASMNSEWKAFEALPAVARRALFEAKFNWSAYAIHRIWKRDRLTGKEVAKLVRAWDRKQHARDVKRGDIPKQRLPR